MKLPIFPALSATFFFYVARLSAMVSFVSPALADREPRDALLYAMGTALIDTIGLVCLLGFLLSCAMIVYRIVNSIDIHSKEEPKS
jgi:hypothetical protein